jgi:tRNA dimethylallyltransferase
MPHSTKAENTAATKPPADPHDASRADSHALSHANPETTSRLIVVLGPTASGKSALGIELAKRLNGEILVCDSTQVYRHFDIGTAKVLASDHSVKTGQQGIAHHLIDLVEPDEVFTAGDYRRHALIALEDLRRRGKLPIITAGTGLYLRALLEGLSEAPARSEELRERLRAIVKARGAAHLHKILARLDRATADRIAPRDTQKIIRAIEMRVLAGKPLAEIFAAGRPGLPVRVRDEQPATTPNSSLDGYAITKIGLQPPRAALYARIDARVEAMLASGWLDEVRALASSGWSEKGAGVPENVKPFQFIGYADLRAHLEGRATLADAVAQIQQSTRRFAKRQLTWFRREQDVRWLEGFGDAPEIAAAAFNLLVPKS